MLVTNREELKFRCYNKPQTARSRFCKPSQILSSVFFRFLLHCHIHVSQVKLVVTNNSLFRELEGEGP